MRMETTFACYFQLFLHLEKNAAVFLRGKWVQCFMGIAAGERKLTSWEKLLKKD